jgi:hypothetical protein
VKIYLHNIHVDGFVLKPIKYFILRKKPLLKFSYLLTLERKSNIYIDCCESSLIPSKYFMYFPPVLRLFISILEVNSWLYLNSISRKQVSISYVKIKSTEPSCVYTFSYRSLLDSASHSRRLFSQFSIIFINLNHYMVRTREKSRNAEKLRGVVFLGESNFTSSSDYFQYHFEWYKKDVMVVPYSSQPRFKNKVNFDERKEKAIATGTFHNLCNEPDRDFYADFIEFYGENTYQPMRREIYSRPDSNCDILDSKISIFSQDVNKSRTNSFMKVFFYRQKSYFSFDIVSLYNEYQIAIIPEELHGMPGIGFCEAMMCGCLYIGIDHAMYRDIGMIPGVHYVTYNGTYNDLIRVIRYCLLNNNESDKIAKSGFYFSKNNFSEEVVSKRLLHQILHGK